MLVLLTFQVCVAEAFMDIKTLNAQKLSREKIDMDGQIQLAQWDCQNVML